MREDKLQLQTQVSWCVFISQQAPRVHYLCSTGLAVTWELSLVGAPEARAAALYRVAFSI